ncbi:YkgJ family cysteine cluster protein [Desulfonatronum thiosulfatophilum]|nr:YkgJ family cysteine cluster protein [Desulfonatronum thiosulfatophilum]
MFDLPLIEALYLNHHFHGVLPKETKNQILTKADQADRASYKLKFQAYKSQRDGVETDVILEDMARKRVRCPLLNSQDRCDLYAFRPITCRLYGIPQEINSKARTCTLTKFEAGVPYPSVHIEKIHQMLAALSMELVASLNTKYSQMADILVPPSMALLTVYDDEYLGLKKSGCGSESCGNGGCASTTGGSCGCNSEKDASGSCGTCPK